MQWGRSGRPEVDGINESIGGEIEDLDGATVGAGLAYAGVAVDWAVGEASVGSDDGFMGAVSGGGDGDEDFGGVGVDDENCAGVLVDHEYGAGHELEKDSRAVGS